MFIVIGDLVKMLEPEREKERERGGENWRVFIVALTPVSECIQGITSYCNVFGDLFISRLHVHAAITCSTKANLYYLGLEVFSYHYTSSCCSSLYFVIQEIFGKMILKSLTYATIVEEINHFDI